MDVHVNKLPAIICAFALVIAASASASEFQAKVVAVTDGDTVRVLDDSQQQVKIRLSEIDAPEKDQPWGQRSKQALSDLVFGQAVTVKVVTTDRYGRTVAKLVLTDGMDVNAEMVRTGDAWVYRKYLLDPVLLEVEKEARGSKRGLWSLQDDQVLPPWEWRRRNR